MSITSFRISRTRSLDFSRIRMFQCHVTPVHVLREGKPARVIAETGFRARGLHVSVQQSADQEPPVTG
jgi:hypothetical protein